MPSSTVDIVAAMSSGMPPIVKTIRMFGDLEWFHLFKLWLYTTARTSIKNRTNHPSPEVVFSNYKALALSRWKHFRRSTDIQMLINNHTIGSHARQAADAKT